MRWRQPSSLLICVCWFLASPAWGSGVEVGFLLGNEIPDLPMIGSFRYEIERRFGFIPALWEPELVGPPEYAPTALARADRPAWEAEALRAVLMNGGWNEFEVARLSAGYAKHRAHWLTLADPDPRNRINPGSAPLLPSGLPPAFEAYARGAEAFMRGDLVEADCEFLRALAQPRPEKEALAVQAMFMHARCNFAENYETALAALESTRALVAQGYPDPLLIEPDALRCQLNLAVDNADWLRAIRNALAEDRRAEVSDLNRLRMLADLALDASTKSLQACAADPEVAGVLTARVLSHPRYVSRWLEALEATEIVVVEADRIAWIAYQAGEYDSARRWLARTSELSAHGQWIQAKLQLREGNRTGARRTLERAVRTQPEVEWMRGWIRETYESSWGEEKYQYELYPLLAMDYLYRVGGEFDCFGPTPVYRIYGELGKLQEADGDVVAALESYMQGPHWNDAAWLADRILTIPELKRYVANHEPISPPTFVGSPLRGSIRHLLARRLARKNHWTEAIPYYPANLQKLATTLRNHRRQMRNSRRSAQRRAAHAYAAARITRHHGMELLGTEHDPDGFAYHEGGLGGDLESLDWNPPPRDPDELPVHPRMHERHDAVIAEGFPTRRFHYRYLAADLAWEAAELLPDDDPATAHILCAAGWWIKGSAPQEADRFYKALVRRNPNIPLAQDADKRRWFPYPDDPEVALDGLPNPVVTVRPIKSYR